MDVLAAARTTLALLICLIVGLHGVAAQTNQENPPLKEVQIASDAFSVSSAVPAWVDPVVMPDANSTQPIIIRLADTQFFVDTTPVTFVHRAVQVNDTASLSAAGQIQIQFIPQYQRVQLHEIHVLRGQEVLDRTASSTIRFLQRETGLEAGVYSGVVTASILVNDLRVGDTLEFSYSLYGQNPVFGDKFVGGIAWDQPFLTQLRRTVLTYPSSRHVAWRMLDGNQAKPLIPTESRRNGMIKLLFQEQPMPATGAEPYEPIDFKPFRWLQFSEFASWDDVVGWANTLFQVDTPLSDELRAAIDKIRARPTSEERVVAALEYVQTEIRYFSVSLGESSHRPTSPNMVLQRRYGDCKDKSLLLVTLLRELGIVSRPVLLQFNRHDGLQNALPSPGLFDHVIVRAEVDGHFFFLDPTRLGQHGRLMLMGQLHEGAQVLVIDRDTHGLATVASENVSDLVHNQVSETATLPKFNGDAKFEVRQVFHGVAAEAVRVLLERQTHEQIARSIGDALESRYPGTKLASPPNIFDDRANNVVTFTTLYTVPKLAIESNGNWLVRFNLTNIGGALVAPPSATRVYPLALGFPFDAEYSFEVKLPEEVSSQADPTVQTVDNDYFTLTSSTSFRGNVSKTAVQLTTHRRRIEPADLQKYSDDLRAANEAVKGLVLINKIIIKSPDAAEAPDLGQVLRARMQELIDKTTETIKSGKVSGNDLAETYCARGSGYVDLDKFDEAFKDVNEAIKTSPNSGTMFACRAEVDFRDGEFDKSVEDYSRAVILGQTRARMFSQRGVSRYYAGQIEEAADDFTKANDFNDRETQLYNDLWLVWTYQRTGRTLPDAVLKRAAAGPQGDWPKPALAMLTGNLSPEDMLKVLDQKSGDDRLMDLAEAYFYIGQHYLTAGDKAKARDYFEKTRKLNVIIYTEHVAAEFELKRLDGH